MSKVKNHQHSLEVDMIRFCPRCAGSLQKEPVEPEWKLQLVCQSCSYVFYLNPKVVAGTIPMKEDRVILLRRKIEPCFGKWTFPAGYVDLGESTREAAVRETREEVCLDVRITRLLNVYSYPQVPVIMIVYLADVVSGSACAGIESLEVRSFGPDELPWEELAFMSTRDALQDWVGHVRF